MFQLRGLLQDIVSDWGSQFASLFWKEFCRLLVATASLYSFFQSVARWRVITKRWKWSQHLLWVEYTHIALPVVSASLSPFQSVSRYDLHFSPQWRRRPQSFKPMDWYNCHLSGTKAWAAPLCTNIGYRSPLIIAAPHLHVKLALEDLHPGR